MSAARTGRSVALALRPFATLVAGAVLASWLLPVAVLRYQRLAEARADAATQLYSASVQVNATEVMSRRFSDTIDEYWQFILASQFREIELDDEKKFLRAHEIAREMSRLASDVSDATESYREAKDDYFRQAAAFESWSLQTAGTLSTLFPSYEPQIHAVFTGAAVRMRNAAESARRREMGYRIVVHVRSSLIRKYRYALRTGQIKKDAYDTKLQELQNVSVKSGSIAVRFPQVLNVAGELRAEAPSLAD